MICVWHMRSHTDNQAGIHVLSIHLTHFFFPNSSCCMLFLLYTQAFKIQSKQLSTKMWCQNMKVYFIGFGVLLVIGLIVLFSTCGFTLSKCKST